jgi:hypothetical protein
MPRKVDTVIQAAEALPSAETAREQPKHVKAYDFDVLKAYRLRVLNHLSYSEIADQLGAPKSSVYKALTEMVALTHDHERIQQFEEIRPALLTAVEERLMASLVDEEAIQKASLNNRAYAYQQVAQQGRLSRGLSTENVGVLGKLILQAEDNLGAGKTTTRSGEAPLQEEVAAKSTDHKA